MEKFLKTKQKPMSLSSPLPGLTIITDFINPQEEAMLLQNIQKEKWDTRLKRWTQHYGYQYQYTTKTITKDNYLGELPKWSDFITKKISDIWLNTDLEISGRDEEGTKEVKATAKLDQIIVNRYLPGEGINPHIDVPSIFGPIIYSLSLESGTVMTFSKGSESIDCYLKPRSLLIMTAEARYKWRHCIKSLTSDEVDGRRLKRGRRISLTLRTMILS